MDIPFKGFHFNLLVSFIRNVKLSVTFLREVSLRWLNVSVVVVYSGRQPGVGHVSHFLVERLETVRLSKIFYRRVKLNTKLIRTLIRRKKKKYNHIQT